MKLECHITGNINPFMLVPYSTIMATTAQAVNPMMVSHVEFTVRNSLPVPRYPPVIAVFDKVLCCLISPGDTVRMSPNDADNIFCRVIDVEADHGLVSQSLILVHPDSVLAPINIGKSIHQNASIQMLSDQSKMENIDGNPGNTTSCIYKLCCLKFPWINN